MRGGGGGGGGKGIIEQDICMFVNRLYKSNVYPQDGVLYPHNA